MQRDEVIQVVRGRDKMWTQPGSILYGHRVRQGPSCDGASLRSQHSHSK